MSKAQPTPHQKTEIQRLKSRIDQLQQELKHAASPAPLLGDSGTARMLRDAVSLVAKSAIPVLLVGEPGVGKEMVARIIHSLGSRATGPFVSVNVAAIPEGQISDTFYGKKLDKGGAFESGCFTAAAGGTLFLLDVAALNHSGQEELSAFLKEQSEKTMNGDEDSIRVIVGISKDPREAIRRRELTEELNDWVGLLRIEMPPLRRRREDIPVMVQTLARRKAVLRDRPVPELPGNVLQVLSANPWAGNIRQLQDVVDRLVVFGKGAAITPDAVTREIRGRGIPSWQDTPGETIEMRVIDELQKRAILDALEKNDGHVRRAAEMLGLGPATVYRKIKRFGLRRTRHVPRGRKPKIAQFVP